VYRFIVLPCAYQLTSTNNNNNNNLIAKYDYLKDDSFDSIVGVLAAEYCDIWPRDAKIK